MFFSWIRRQARDAVLGGIADALDELDRDQAPGDVEAARKRFAIPTPDTKQLAAKEEEAESGGKKRKAG